ncbi:MAG TPA: SIMPL domain-containing protein [Ilumatobacteraceae bacterium]|nr:SIMPL domain-containing protein [Ilumatobacteraceae bacterium]
MSSVTVRGSALAAVTPDRAELSLALTHLAPDAAGALDEIAARSQRLEQILIGLGFNSDDWATDGVQIAEEYQWKKETNVLVGHRATTALTVTIRSPDLVSAVIRDGVSTAGASVRSLAWRVDDDNPARAALLGAAARDARVRATAYVEALDLHLGDVELISETPIEAEPSPHPRMMMAAKMADGGGAGELSVNGGRVELSAEVSVRFTINVNGE